MKAIKMILLGLVSFAAPVLFIKQAVTLTHLKEINSQKQLTISADSLEINQLKRELDSAKTAKISTNTGGTTIIKIPSIYPGVLSNSPPPSKSDTVLTVRQAYDKIMADQDNLVNFSKKMQPVAPGAGPNKYAAADIDQFWKYRAAAKISAQKYEKSTDDLLRRSAIHLDHLADSLTRVIVSP